MDLVYMEENVVQGGAHNVSEEVFCMIDEWFVIIY